jgi:hypothetical protein
MIQYETPGCLAKIDNLRQQGDYFFDNRVLSTAPQKRPHKRR